MPSSLWRHGDLIGAKIDGKGALTLKTGADLHSAVLTQAQVGPRRSVAHRERSFGARTPPWPLLAGSSDNGHQPGVAPLG